MKRYMVLWLGYFMGAIAGAVKCAHGSTWMWAVWGVVVVISCVLSIRDAR